MAGWASFIRPGHQIRRFVALKFLPEDLAEDDLRSKDSSAKRSRFRPNHPNICTIYLFNQYDGHRFIAMEFPMARRSSTTSQGVRGNRIAARLEHANCGRAQRRAQRRNHSSRHQARQSFHHRPRPREILTLDWPSSCRSGTRVAEGATQSGPGSADEQLLTPALRLHRYLHVAGASARRRSGPGTDLFRWVRTV